MPFWRSLRSSFGTRRPSTSGLICRSPSRRRPGSTNCRRSCSRRARRCISSSSATSSILRSRSAPARAIRRTRSACRSTTTSGSSSGGPIVPRPVRHPALGPQRQDLVSDHGRAAERHRGRIDRPSVLLVVPLSASQRRSHRRDAPSGQRAGHAEPYLRRRHPFVLGSGDASEKRHGARPGHDDPFQTDAGRPLPDRLHAVLRNRA